jgi:hypothetical protein
MSGEAVLKPDKDFSTEVDKQLPEAEELAKVAMLASRWNHSTFLLMTAVHRPTFKELSRNLPPLRSKRDK